MDEIFVHGELVLHLAYDNIEELEIILKKGGYNKIIKEYTLNEVSSLRFRFMDVQVVISVMLIHEEIPIYVKRRSFNKKELRDSIDDILFNDFTGNPNETPLSISVYIDSDKINQQSERKAEHILKKLRKELVHFAGGVVPANEELNFSRETFEVEIVPHIPIYFREDRAIGMAERVVKVILGG